MTEGPILCFIPIAELIPVLLFNENNHIVITQDQDHTGLLLWASRDAEVVDDCKISVTKQRSLLVVFFRKTNTKLIELFMNNY